MEIKSTIDKNQKYMINRNYIGAEFEALKKSISDHYNNCISDVPDRKIINSFKKEFTSYGDMYGECLRVVRCLVEESLNLILYYYSHKVINYEVCNLENIMVGGSYPVGIYMFKSLYQLSRQSIKEHFINLRLKFCNYGGIELYHHTIRIEDELLEWLTDNKILRIIRRQTCNIRPKNQMKNIIKIINRSFQHCIRLIKNKFNPNELIELYSRDIDNYYSSFNNPNYMLEFVPNTYKLAYVVTSLTPIQVKLDNKAEVEIGYSKNGGILSIISNQDLKPLNKDLGLEIINKSRNYTGCHCDYTALEYKLEYYFYNESVISYDYYYDKDSSMILTRDGWYDNTSSQNMHHIKIINSEGINNSSVIFRVLNIDNIMYITDCNISDGNLTIFRLEHE